MSKHASQVSRLRSRLGEDRETFGQRFGVEGNTVYQWERGLRSPSKAALLIMDTIRRHLSLKQIETAS